MAKAKELSVSGFNVEVKNSPGKGRGVFAVRPLWKGDVIEVAPVLMVPLEDEPLIWNTFLQHYTFGVAIGDDDLTAIALGNASLYNHSSNYNADWVINNKVIIVRAVRDIKKGAEITVDYGWDAEHLAEVGIKP